jgi:late competence protein required for DNA uptake (superfamily II DNA/RNA helicase)
MDNHSSIRFYTAYAIVIIKAIDVFGTIKNREHATDSSESTANNVSLVIWAGLTWAQIELQGAWTDH